MAIIAARVDHKRLREPGYLDALKHLGVQSATVVLKNLTDEGLEQVHRNFPHILGHHLIGKRQQQRFSSVDALQDYITKTIQRWPLITEWDVLTEVFHGDRLDPVMDNTDWPMYAYAAAREAAPTASLWLNEYALKNKRYWDCVLELAGRLKARGLLDGVGIQRHIDLRGKLKLSGHSRWFDYGFAHLASVVPMPRLAYECDRITEMGLAVQFPEISVRAFTWQHHCQRSLYLRLLKVGEQKAERVGFWYTNRGPKSVDGNPEVYEVLQCPSQ